MNNEMMTQARSGHRSGDCAHSSEPGNWNNNSSNNKFVAVKSHRRLKLVYVTI